jgi:hypothetical protein
MIGGTKGEVWHLAVIAVLLGVFLLLPVKLTFATYLILIYALITVTPPSITNTSNSKHCKTHKNLQLLINPFSYNHAIFINAQNRH